jgi:hypothetical protein
MGSINHGVGRLRELRDDGIGHAGIAICVVSSAACEHFFATARAARSRKTFRITGHYLITPLGSASHSRSFDHRRRPEMLRTAIATAFFWPTSTTSFLPRVTPV